MLFREHRGTLEDSMKTCVPLVNTPDALAKHIASLDILLPSMNVSEALSVEPYCFDERIKWNTYIVTIKGYGVIGYTNEMIIDW